MPRFAPVILLACLLGAIPTQAGTVSVRVNASSSDAEEDSDGDMTLDSTTLDLENQWVGLRFTNVAVPKGAYITTAYVTFTARNSDSTSTSVTIFGHDTDNSSAFTTSGHNISDRSRTSASAGWASIPSWTAGSTYSTPELKSVVQEVVNRSGWTSGNSLSILFQRSSGSRRAQPYDNSTTLCPLLYVEYAPITPPVANRLLFVVTNSAAPTSEETARRSAFQQWGYVVTLISASASQAAFDTAAASNDVAYISEAAIPAEVNTKLKGKSLGVVNANTGLADDFAIAASTSTVSGTSINIDSSSHYLTSPWPIGSLAITTSSQTLTTISGNLAVGRTPVASIGGANSFVAVEIGAKLNDGTRASGRRVQLPWGGSSFAFSSLSADGLNLLSRALAWAGGVVGYWKFDETSGTIASDSSVNLHAGTLTNFSFDTSRVASAKVGGGLSFDGSNDYISSPNTATLQLTKAMSMSAWIKGSVWNATGDEEDDVGWANVIVRKGAQGPNNYQLAIENGYVAMGLDGIDGSNTHGNTLLQTGVWHHVAATWDGSTVKIYVNGVLDNTPKARAAPVGTDTRALYLGGRSGNTDIFNGQLDEVRLYNHALGVDEITVLRTIGQLRGVRIIKVREIP